MMNKTRNNTLLKLANDALIKLANDSRLKDCRLLKDGSIEESYNGQIAALGVTIAMSGLLPALAIYYQDKPDRRKVCRRNILEVIARMIHEDKADEKMMAEYTEISDAKSLLKKAIGLQGNGEHFRKLQREVEECSIALKQVVRTYNLVKNEES